jgi:hypothetical protein
VQESHFVDVTVPKYEMHSVWISLFDRDKVAENSLQKSCKLGNLRVQKMLDSAHEDS